jgi:hypothetical protein
VSLEPSFDSALASRLAGARMSTSARLNQVLERENFVAREDLQQDKRAALAAVARLFDDYQVPYVITGGLAVQLYDIQVRPTVDLDIVAPRPGATRRRRSARRPR